MALQHQGHVSHKVYLLSFTRCSSLFVFVFGGGDELHLYILYTIFSCRHLVILCSAALGTE